jgi:hypothetical protein
MGRILKRPVGITFLASLLTFIGGAMTLMTLIEVFDALRALGLNGITFDKPVSFFGFLLYGAGPVFFYSLGLGLFMSQRWAYVFTEKVLPFFAFFLFINLAINVVRTQQPYLYRFNVFHLVRLRPQMFLWTIFWYVLLMWSLLAYLRLPYIQAYFQSEKLIS